MIINWFNFLDVTNEANILLVKLKEIIEKLQAEKNYFRTQVEKLQIENKQLFISNKSLEKKVDSFQKNLQRKTV